MSTFDNFMKRRVTRHALKVTDNVMPVSTCPHCGKQVDRATGIGAHVPQPGAVSVCVSCAGISVIGDDMQLRLPTDAEYEEFKDEPELKMYLDFVKKHQAGRGSPDKGS